MGVSDMGRAHATSARRRFQLRGQVRLCIRNYFPFFVVFLGVNGESCIAHLFLLFQLQLLLLFLIVFGPHITHRDKTCWQRLVATVQLDNETKDFSTFVFHCCLLTACPNVVIVAIVASHALLPSVGRANCRGYETRPRPGPGRHFKYIYNRRALHARSSNSSSSNCYAIKSQLPPWYLIEFISNLLILMFLRYFHGIYFWFSL